MISLKQGYINAHVWLGELPELSYPTTETVIRVLETGQQPITEIRKAAVEILLPRGGRALYGLLGAEFEPSESDRLVIQVAVTSNSNNDKRYPSLTRFAANQQLEWSLAAHVDQIQLGLPLEYLNSVLVGALSSGKLLGPGILRYNRAAHGLVGSSQWVFHRLAETVVQLLKCDSYSISEDQLIGLLRFRE